MKNEAGRRTDNVKMTDLLLGQLERGSASARLDRVFRRDQAYCPTRREADFEDAGLSSGAAIEFVNVIPGRQFEWRLAPVLVRAGIPLSLRADTTCGIPATNFCGSENHISLTRTGASRHSNCRPGIT